MCDGAFHGSHAEEQVALVKRHGTDTLLFCPDPWALRYRFVNKEPIGTKNSAILNLELSAKDQPMVVTVVGGRQKRLTLIRFFLVLFPHPYRLVGTPLL